MWGVVLIFRIASTAINLLLHGPVGTCAETLAHKPFSTFLTGLIVLRGLRVRFGPSRRVGDRHCDRSVFPVRGLRRLDLAAWASRAGSAEASAPGSIETPIEGVRSFLIGFAVRSCRWYMVPVIGLYHLGDGRRVRAWCRVPHIPGGTAPRTSGRSQDAAGSRAAGHTDAAVVRRAAGRLRLSPFRLPRFLTQT